MDTENRLNSLPLGVLDFWNCLIRNEYQLINAEISLEDFVLANEQCNSLMVLRKGQSNVQSVLPELNAKKNKQQNLIAFPNPTSGSIALRYTKSSNKMLSVKVFTRTGMLVDEFKASAAANNFILDLGSVTSGLYVLEVIDQNNTRNRIKVIKQ